jgi:hypothetical protein
MDEFEKVKYIGHLDGCLSCSGLPMPPDSAWEKRIGKLAILLGTHGRREGTVKVHFEGEDSPVYTYRSHLCQA